MKCIICIYIIINQINKKKYIGQTKNFDKRKKDYLNGYFPNKDLRRAFKKYGRNNFTFEIIEQCKIEDLDRLEKFYIKKFNTTNPKKGYNTKTGGNPRRGLSDTSRGRVQAVTRILDKQILFLLGKGLLISEIAKKLSIAEIRVKKVIKKCD